MLRNSPGSASNSIDNIPLPEWDTPIVLQFLTNQKVTDKKVHQIFETNQINGIMLASMTLDDLKRLGVPIGFANTIIKKVASLKEYQEKFIDADALEMRDLAKDIIPSTSAKDIIPNMSQGSDELQGLSCSYDAKDTSSSTVFVACPMWNVNKFNDTQKQQFEFCMPKLDFLPETNNPNFKQTICQNLIFPNRFMYEYLNPQRIPEYKQQVPNTGKESSLKVRLVITELSEATTHRIVRKFGAIVGLTGDVSYGMFHTALIVGPWYLEWGDKSLAMVRQRSSAKAVFVATIGEIKGTERVSQKLVALAQVCADWNATKTYDKTKCNCQHFTEAAIEALNMSIEFNHNIDAKTKKYLEKMKQLGSGERVYKVDKELKKVLLDSNVITTDNDTLQLIQNMRKKIESNSKFYFKTHKELDEFVKFAITVHPLFTSSQDYAFLKGFDRAFWLKYQSEKSRNDIPYRETCKPLMESESICLCPFNPTQDHMDNVNMTVVGQDFVLEAQCGWKPPKQ
ncbi:hypothetical protein C9374_014374 [Naegleria lovaniensis]|uniref:SAM domain-containing protein n=1 Tax=Naegleria lovaniensis TaxID=51637 RepID=A0AA88KPC6_NAELO|nr:uncharacterized protein C9374_014374 [Naegleria lovaniensis]KAG2388974.1 hypothetical protein C9374_014374 [Naegleria lovaniensis]